MSQGILILALGRRKLPNPEWVVEFSPDTPGRFDYPTGDLITNVDPAKAKRFDDKAQAFRFVRQQSKNVPLRPDGLPNRPLTAFTVSIEELPE